MRTFFIITLSLWLILSPSVANGVTREPASLLNQYYFLKKHNYPRIAKITLQLLLQLDPDNIIALKEMGYSHLQEQKPAEALPYFEKAFSLNAQDYNTVMQIGYILDGLGKKQNAVKYFTLVANADSASLDLKQKANTALKNIVPQPKTSTAPGPVVLYPIPPTKKSTAMPALEPLQPKPELPFPQLKMKPMDEYYSLKKSNPQAAIALLNDIIKKDPGNVQALTEMAYFKLNSGNKAEALHYFKKSNALHTDDRIASQIGFLLYEFGKKQEAYQYFKSVSHSQDIKLQTQALKAMKVIQSEQTVKIPMPKLSRTEYLFNQYYHLRKTNPENIRGAEQILNNILAIDPDNINALTEMAYLQLGAKDLQQAYCYFKRVFALTHEYKIAAQLGYTADALGLKHQAYQYFEYATKTDDRELRLRSNIAMTNLAGWQYRVLPHPLFADVYFSPLYFHRFDNYIFPVISRAGIYFGPDNRGELYFSFRSTRDTQSSPGAITATTTVGPQIFEDNAAIYAAGIRYFPFKKIPLYFYGEAGRAYDWVYRNRDRWRGDIRGGAVYINAWGAHPTYTDTIRFPFKWVMDAYGDATYFSRFDNNVIGYFRLRPGLRLFEYRSTYANIYIRNNIIADTNHEFYNNVYEVGPGIALIPNNRYNLAFRYEVLRGYYIKVNSPSPNPYGSSYNNQLIYLELYARF